MRRSAVLSEVVSSAASSVVASAAWPVVASCLALLLAAACGRSGFEVDTDFVDGSFETGFSAGTFNGTRWAGDHLELIPGVTTGTYVSRVFDAGDSSARWNELRWLPGAPYGKPLPDNGVSEGGYPAGNFAMTNNVLLVHFEDRIDDSSSELNRMFSVKVVGYSTGVFGRALVDAADNYVYTLVESTSSPFNSQSGELSWALWAKSTSSCPGNTVYMGVENPSGDPFKQHLWLGCSPKGGGPSGVLGNTWCTDRTDNDCVQVPGDAVITDGRWHHLAIVKAGHSPGTLTTYVDGVRQGVLPTAYHHPLKFNTGVEVALGALSKGTYPATTELDEAAIWRRALTEAEIQQLYRRGAQRLSVLVRACPEPTCSGVPFAGPGGDATRGYTEPATALKANRPMPITNLIGRYVQYQIQLSTDDPKASPTLYEVALTRE